MRDCPGEVSKILSLGAIAYVQKRFRCINFGRELRKEDKAVAIRENSLQVIRRGCWQAQNLHVYSASSAILISRNHGYKSGCSYDVIPGKKSPKKRKSECGNRLSSSHVFAVKQGGEQGRAI